MLRRVVLGTLMWGFVSVLFEASQLRVRGQLRKAIAIVPRCQRAHEVLNITAGPGLNKKN